MRKYRQKPFAVSQWVLSAVAALQPKERLTTSQWAEKYRILGNESAMPGTWRNRTTPYLVGIMDEFSTGDAERIIFVKPTQVGGTAAMENMLGSMIDQDPAPAMVVYPSDALAKGTVKTKLLPMVQNCANLKQKYKAHESNELELVFQGMRVHLTGANSPADLSSKAIRYLMLDEVDKYPFASKREADPISLAIERTKTFVANRKIFITSTPTLKSGHIWRQKESADCEKHYFVPCPHCGKHIELVFAQIRWASKEEQPNPRERAQTAVYVCQKCGSIITDREKPQMLQQGKWQVVRGDSVRAKSVVFWISTLYSPFTKYADIAAEFMRSKGDSELRQNFTNSWLAESWEDTKIKTNADMVLERQSQYPAWTLPPWAKMLTGGVDVQENCLYWVIRAWGEDMTSQNIAHGQALSTREVAQVMNTEFTHPEGHKLLVDLAIVDSGDQTDEVYAFCAANAEWALPGKGTATMASHYRISVVNKAGSTANGTRLILVDGGRYKDMIASRMRKPNGMGAWMVHADCDRDYAEQVTAEHKVTERKGGRAVTAWRPKASHVNNHYLDAEVYATAAADIRGVRNLDFGVEKQEVPKQTKEPATQQEESWISQHDNWI